MIQRLISATARPWVVALGLLALCAASYATMASKLGYHWDDWTIAWYIHFLGPSSFKEAFALDRPLLAPIYLLTTTLIGNSPLHWQIFAVFTRWLACVALWLTLRGLWPEKPLQTAAAASLFAVYPGFRQQYIAITYGNAFILLTLYLASWALMVWSLRKPRWFWQFFLASLILDSFCVFASEHLFGLELLRPIFIWLILSDTIKDPAQRFKRLILIWLPFLIIDALFLVWRIATPTPRAEITLLKDLSNNPGDTLIRVAQTALQDMFQAGVLAWGQILRFDWLSDQTPIIIMKYFAIVSGVLIGVALLLKTQQPDSQHPSSSNRRWAWRAIGLGALGLFAAGVPIWPTNLRIELFFPWDRFTIPMMLGASVLIVGVIELISWFPYQNIILIALISGLAAGMHFQNALSFRRDWLMQRDFFWQLSWRAPAIQPGTVLLTSEMPFPYDWDNSLNAPLNWTFAPEFEGQELPYLIYNVESRLSRGLPELERNSQIEEYLRITPFRGTISQSLVVFFRPPGACLKIIDPVLDRDMPDKPRYFQSVYKFSRPELISPHAQPAAKPPLEFFGPEPERDWCYYFEKAELARQFEDWSQIVELGDQAMKNTRRSFNRRNVIELVPFIEGYAHAGRWDTAYQLTLQALEAWENADLLLCNTWMRIRNSGQLGADGDAAFEKITEMLGCKLK